jgi:hypothetical protein
MARVLKWSVGHLSSASGGQVINPSPEASKLIHLPSRPLSRSWDRAEMFSSPKRAPCAML